MAEHAHEAALVGLASDIAREIEAHDAFDCPEGWTYVRAANAIAMRLVERFGRPAPDPTPSQSERIAAAVEAEREACARLLEKQSDEIDEHVLAASRSFDRDREARLRAVSGALADAADTIRARAALPQEPAALAPLGEE